MSRRVGALVLAPYLAVVVGVVGVVGVTVAPPGPGGGAGGATCYEEQPCWDCTTMGNHQCGPGAASAVGR